MKKLIFVSAILFSLAGKANENPTIPFRADCETTSGQLAKHVVINSEFVWASYGTDLGPTTIQVTSQEDQKTIMSLAPQNQTFFRETELGILFFGTYKNANLTAPNQTVHVLLAYQSIISVLQELALAAGDAKYKVPTDRDFILSAFAEEDRHSNIIMQLKCNFSLKK